MDLKELLEDILGKDSEEMKTLVECFDIISKNPPTTQSEAKVRMFILDSVRIKLSNIYFLLNRLSYYYKSSYQEEYNKQYTRLVKLGRPSNYAIEAEIKTTNPDYVTSINKISSLDDVKELVSSYIRCVDECKRTAVEVFKNSLRLD